MMLQSLYGILQSIGATSSICDIRAHCLLYQACTRKSTIDIIDFDEVARDYQNKTGAKETPSSVDAITINKQCDKLILIEKKTWYQFYQHFGQDKSVIDEKVNEYKQTLNEKYNSTNQILCFYLSLQLNELEKLPKIYIWTTEIDGQDDPTEGFATMIAVLANCNIANEVQAYTVRAMQNAVKDIPLCVYVPCKEFDNYVANL